jgi:hypothetical protein
MREYSLPSGYFGLVSSSVPSECNLLWTTSSFESGHLTDKMENKRWEHLAQLTLNRIPQLLFLAAEERGSNSCLQKDVPGLVDTSHPGVQIC